MMWGELLHLSSNMWWDRPLAPETKRVRGVSGVVQDLNQGFF